MQTILLREPTMERIVLDPVMEYLDGPTIQHTRDVVALRLNRQMNVYITTSKALTRFWTKMHRRTSHHCHSTMDMTSCYNVTRWNNHILRARMSNLEIRDRMRAQCGECENVGHRTYLTYVTFQPIDDGTPMSTRHIYREWQVLAYKRLGRTWNKTRNKKLERLQAQVAAMEADKAAFEKRKEIYEPLVKAENKRIRKAKTMTV